ncbi:MAG: hypothetical protein AB9917_24650 [Negativicutes bacterium]
MKWSFLKTRKSFIFSILLCFLISVFSAGCANLKAIKAFSQISVDAVLYTQFADDYVNAVNERESYLSRLGEKSEYDGKTTKEMVIMRREGVRNSLVAIHNKLADYMTIMGKLASSDTTISSSNKKSLDEIVEKMVNAQKDYGDQYFSYKDIKTFEGLANILIEAVNAKYRQDQLKKLIELSNNYFEKLSNILIDFISLYENDLKHTKDDVANSYYSRVVPNINPSETDVAVIQKLSGETGFQRSILADKRDETFASIEKKRGLHGIIRLFLLP